MSRRARQPFAVPRLSGTVRDGPARARWTLRANTPFGPYAIVVGTAASLTKTTVRPPWQVRNLTATPGNGRVLLRWERPSSLGGEGAMLVRYEHRQKEENNAWGAWHFAGDPNSNGRVLTGLDNGTRYSFCVRAINQGLAGPDGSSVSTAPAPQLRLNASSGGFRQGGDGVRVR